MSDPLEKAKQRAYRYWYSDGFAEMITGSVFLLGGALTASQLIPQTDDLPYLLLVTLTVVFIGYALFGRKIIAILKQRHTYPRTGYVRYQRPSPKRRWIWLGISIVVMTITQLLQQFFSLKSNTGGLISSIIIGILFIYLGYRIRLNRLYGAGVLSIALGLLLPSLFNNATLILSIHYGSLGIWLIVSGIITRAHYLQNAPPPEEMETSA